MAQGKFEGGSAPLLQRKEEEEPEENEEEEEPEPVQAKRADESIVQRREDEEKENENDDELQTSEEEETVQPKTSGSISSSVSPAVESNIQSLRGGGQPLSSSSRAYFEPRFGADFSGVRVHTDANANHLTRSINAKAFTVGRDVVFGAGQYNPESSEGKKLMAHELTHVVQQTTIGNNVNAGGGGGISRIQRQKKPSKTGMRPPLVYIGHGWRHVVFDKSFMNKIARLKVTPPVPASELQPPVSINAYKSAKEKAKDSIKPGSIFKWRYDKKQPRKITNFNWKFDKKQPLQTLEIKSFDISANPKVRSVKTMVGVYFGNNDKYILGFLFHEINQQYKFKCRARKNKNKPVKRNTVGVAGKFFRARTSKRLWSLVMGKVGSHGIAAFPGLSRHAGRGAFDLHFKIKCKTPQGQIIKSNAWGNNNSSYNSLIRATPWWKQVNSAFKKNKFKNIPAEYWHFNYDKKKMPKPKKVLDVRPLQEALIEIAVYAYALELEMADLARKCLRGGLKGNKSKLKLTKKLKEKINNAKKVKLIQRAPTNVSHSTSSFKTGKNKQKSPHLLQPKMNINKSGTITLLSIESGIQSLRGGGQPLSKSSRAYFEPRFGTDFSNVRVHTNANANYLARSINAKAFTLGRDVVFGAGQYRPESSDGKRLMAHELTHVVQQGRALSLQTKDNQNQNNVLLKPEISRQRTKQSYVQRAPGQLFKASTNPLVVSVGKKWWRQYCLVVVSPKGITAVPDIFIHFHGWKSNYGIDKQRAYRGRKAGSDIVVKSMANMRSNLVAVLPQGKAGAKAVYKESKPDSNGKVRKRLVAAEGGTMKAINKMGFAAFIKEILLKLAKRLKINRQLSAGKISVSGHSAGGYQGVARSLYSARELKDNISEVTLMDTAYSRSHFQQAENWLYSGSPGKSLRIVGQRHQVEWQWIPKDKRAVSHYPWFGPRVIARRARDRRPKGHYDATNVKIVDPNRDHKSKVLQHTKITKDGKPHADVLVVRTEVKAGTHEALRDQFIDDALHGTGQGMAGSEYFGRGGKKPGPSQKAGVNKPNHPTVKSSIDGTKRRKRRRFIPVLGVTPIKEQTPKKEKPYGTRP